MANFGTRPGMSSMSSQDFLSSSTSIKSAPVLGQSYCIVKWNEALAACRSNLHETEITDLFSCHSCNELLQTLSAQPSSLTRTTDINLVQRLSSSLEPLSRSIEMVKVAIGLETVDVAITWGLIRLLFKQISYSNDPLLRQVLNMMDELGAAMDYFCIMDPMLAKNSRIVDDVIDILAEFSIFWSRAISFLRRNKHVSVDMANWLNVRKEFENMTRKVQRRCQQVKERANTMNLNQPQSHPTLLQDLDRMGPQRRSTTSSLSGKSTGLFPTCDNIPFQRNRNLFGRKAELQTIRDTIGPASSADSFRSFALYGTGGIGKTQIALAYAYQEVDNGCSAVIWLDCETGLSLARSFRQVANMLELEDASASENSDQNKFAVLQWLRKAVVRWLVVMDNVEDLKLIYNAWPIASAGAVLVTSRNEIVSIDPAAGGLEIAIFEVEEATTFLLRMAGRETASDEEKKYARELADRLNGLALALATMAAQVKIRKKSFKEFITFYERHYTHLNKERRGIESQYKYSLDSCWLTAFEYLNGEARKILGVISICAPDQIPQELFEVNTKSLSDQFEDFTSDQWLVETAIDQLVSTALIRKDYDTQMMTIHRLTQEEFRNHQTENEKHESFVLASELLCRCFPKHVNGLSLRNEEKQCKLFVQHVLFLCRAWQASKFRPKFDGEFRSFLELSTACGWYLMESGAWSEEFELMAVAMELCEDKNGLIYSHLCNSYGIVEMERAHAEAALPYMTKSLEIRQNLLPPDHEELANLYNNFGNMILQDYKEDARQVCIDYQQRAIKIDMTKPKAERDLILHIRHANIGRTLTLLGKHEEAEWYIEQARGYALANFGPETHWDATCDYYRGNISFNQNKIEEAKRYWTRAAELFAKDNVSHPSTIATKMKMACIASQEGEHKEAILTLEHLMLLSQLSEGAKGDRGQTARIMRRLADVYIADGNISKGESMKEAAEAIRKEIQGARFDTLADNEMSYNLLVYHSFW